jgi:hypothetical protein
LRHEKNTNKGSRKRSPGLFTDGDFALCKNRQPRLSAALWRNERLIRIKAKKAFKEWKRLANQLRMRGYEATQKE